MLVRRTGARRHEHPYWYIYADRAEEQAAMRAGLLKDQAPDARFKYVVTFGLRSRQAAEVAMADFEPIVQAAIARL